MVSPAWQTFRPQVVELLRRCVKPQRGEVPAFIFHDPDVYRLEVERIFQRSWLYVLHESEVPAPGDYVTRHMGEERVIAARGEDGEVRVFLNMCRHRGMRICRSDMGNASHFRCPYHGFTYANRGELVGVPFQKEVYGGSLDRAELGLVRATSASYRGMVFATWNPEPEPLEEFLGDARWYLDLVAGRAEMEVLGPPHRWEIPTNWKLAAENFASDSYHTLYTHRSIAVVGEVTSPDYFRRGYHISPGNGHGLGISVPTPAVIFPEELFPEYGRNLTPEQLAVLRQMKNTHGTIAPNLSFDLAGFEVRGRTVSFTSLRQWQPKGPDRIEALSWLYVEKDAPAWWKDASRQLYVLNFGTSGMFEQDDTENWQDITGNCRGPVGSTLSFNYSMGLDRKPTADFAGPGTVYGDKWLEANARAFYSWWLERLTAEQPRRGRHRPPAKGER